MGVVYDNALRTTRMTAVRDAIDAGAGAGALEICTAGYGMTLLSYPFSEPCGVVGGDPAALIFSDMPKEASGLAGGYAVLARIKTSEGAIVVSGLTVGGIGSGADIEIDNLNIQSGQTVNLLSGQLVHG